MNSRKTLLCSAVFALAIIASTYFLKHSAGQSFAEATLTVTALAFVILPNRRRSLGSC